MSFSIVIVAASPLVSIPWSLQSVALLSASLLQGSFCRLPLHHWLVGFFLFLDSLLILPFVSNYLFFKYNCFLELLAFWENMPFLLRLLHKYHKYYRTMIHKIVNIVHFINMESFVLLVSLWRYYFIAIYST